MAVNFDETELIHMNGRGFMNNPRLRLHAIKNNWTKDQIIEYTKCYNDPIYFIENYIKIVHLDRGIIPFKMYDYQKRMVEAVHNNRFSCALCPRQQGKCFSIDTKVKVRHKSTGIIEEITLGELHARARTNQTKKDGDV